MIGKNARDFPFIWTPHRYGNVLWVVTKDTEDLVLGTAERGTTPTTTRVRHFPLCHQPKIAEYDDDDV